MRELVCDFCSAAEPRWKFNARDFEYGIKDLSGADRASFSAWLACDACKQLIELDKWRRLCQRSLAVVVRKSPEKLSSEDRAIIAEGIADVHKRFRANRQGDPVPLTRVERDALAQGPGRWREWTTTPRPEPAPWLSKLR